MLERRPLLLHVRAVGWDAALQHNRSIISRSEPKQWLRLPYVSISPATPIDYFSIRTEAVAEITLRFYPFHLRC
jgi:hypothetical protein